LRSRIHSGEGSCHQIQSERKKTAAFLQVRPRPEELLLASRQNTALSRQHSTLRPTLRWPVPLLCFLWTASPPDRAPDRPGSERRTLKGGWRRGRGGERKKSPQRGKAWWSPSNSGLEQVQIRGMTARSCTALDLFVEHIWCTRLTGGFG
jgi:hypothetical protein